ncbi:MAG: cyclic-di-AMP receptor [Chloroflexi bacterium]|nr:cyclic-di-AMP receptor [Chloroflexota bacterium]
MSKDTTIRSLVLAVVQEQDQDAAVRAVEALNASVVNLSSSGGFLGRRNATLLVGLPEGREQAVLDTLQKTCRQRVEYMTLPLEGSPMPMPAPVPVTVGGATVFVLPVEYFEEI